MKTQPRVVDLRSSDNEGFNHAAPFCSNLKGLKKLVNKPVKGREGLFAVYADDRELWGFVHQEKVKPGYSFPP